MAIDREELKKKAFAAASAEEVMELVRAAGEEITEKEAKEFFENAQKLKASAQKADDELSLEELEAISGGDIFNRRDYSKEGCAATVGIDSFCWSNDSCYFVDITYIAKPRMECKICGRGAWHTGYAIGRGREFTCHAGHVTFEFD